MDQSELALLYGLSASQPEGDKVQTLLRDAEIPFKEVLPQELGLRVGALAGLDTVDSCPPMVEPFPQSTIVFCGLSEQRLREVLALMREKNAGTKCTKAVLTPGNRDWRFCDLLLELAKERDAFARMMRQKADGEKNIPTKQDQS